MAAPTASVLAAPRRRAILAKSTVGWIATAGKWARTHLLGAGRSREAGLDITKLQTVLAERGRRSAHSPAHALHTSVAMAVIHASMHLSIRMGAASYLNRTRQAPRSRWRRTAPTHLASHLPIIQRVFADSGYAGEKVANATLIAVEIVRKNPDQIGFAVQPRRWVVERFFAWIGRNRRLAKDFEATIDSARAFLYAASVMLLVRRIARAS